jgi:hypothetical protein
MPLAVVTVSRGVLAKGRQENAVRKSKASQFQGLEQLGDWLAIFADEGYTCGRRLKRSKVRNLVKRSVYVWHIEMWIRSWHTAGEARLT